MMAMFIRLLCMCVATLAGAHYRYRHQPRCDRQAAPYGCLRTPLYRHAMNLNVFRQKNQCGSRRHGLFVKAEGRLISRNRAIFDIDLTLPILGLQNYRVWLMSEQPDALNIGFWCSDRNAIVNEVCQARRVVQITIMPERMNNPPMDSILDELYRKLRLRLDDPRNTFLWDGYDIKHKLTSTYSSWHGSVLR